MTEVEKPEWLVPGARVVLYTKDGRHNTSTNARVDVVTKVGKMWFTVSDDSEPRFRIDRLSVSGGSTWSGWTRYVLPFNDPEAQHELMLHRKWKLRKLSEAKMDEWQKSPTRDNTHAVITALTKLLELSDEDR